MALKPCPSCTNEVARSAVACPHCGHNLAAARSFVWAGVIVVVMAIAAAASIGGVS